MVAVKSPEKLWVQDVVAGDPQAFLWAMPLPVHHVLSSATPSEDIEDLSNCVGWCPIDESHRWGGQLRESESQTGLILKTWKVGWAVCDVGNSRCTAASFTTRSTLKGPTKRGASFRGGGVEGEGEVPGGQPDSLSAAIHWGKGSVLVRLLLNLD